MGRVWATTLVSLLALAGMAQTAPNAPRSPDLEGVSWVEGLLDLQKPQHVVLVLDGSKLTAGRRAEFIRTAAAACVKQLRDKDLVSVIVYNGTAKVLVSACAPTDKEAILRAINAIEPEGQAALFAGVSLAAEEVRQNKSHGRVNRVLVLGGALGNVGPRSAEELGVLVRALAKEGIEVTLPGMGVR